MDWLIDYLIKSVHQIGCSLQSHLWAGEAGWANQKLPNCSTEVDTRPSSLFLLIGTDLHLWLIGRRSESQKVDSTRLKVTLNWFLQSSLEPNDDEDKKASTWDKPSGGKKSGRRRREEGKRRRSLPLWIHHPVARLHFQTAKVFVIKLFVLLEPQRASQRLYTFAYLH